MHNAHIKHPKTFGSNTRPIPQGEIHMQSQGIKSGKVDQARQEEKNEIGF